jgi:hypothetical protein
VGYRRPATSLDNIGRGIAENFALLAHVNEHPEPYVDCRNAKTAEETRAGLL